MTEPEDRVGNEASETVAVAGATGNAGREIVRALVERGHRVRALVRNPDRLGALRERCAEVRVVQVTERGSLRGALDGADRVVSALGKTWQKDAVPRRLVDVEANLNLMHEAKRSGTKRFGLLSVAWASMDHPATMVRMKAEVEDALRHSGLPFVIIQPSGFFSDLWEVLEMCKKGTFWAIGDGRLRFNPISLVDLGDFVAEALFNDDRPGQSLPIGGPQTFDSFDLASLCGRVLEREVKVRNVPLWLAKAGVAAVRPFSRNLFEMGEFFVGNTVFGVQRDNDGTVPAYGTHQLEAYYRDRLAKGATPSH